MSNNKRTYSNGSSRNISPDIPLIPGRAGIRLLRLSCRCYLEFDALYIAV